MAVELLVPRLDMTTEAVTIIRWIKGEGQPVRKGEPILEVMTEKVSIEVESPADGTLWGICHGPDATVGVGELLAFIAGADEAIAAPDPDAATAAPEPVLAAPPAPPPGPVRASPAVRRLARQLGIDIRMVAGSGPSGRVRAEDLQAAAAAAVPSAAAALAAAPAVMPASTPAGADGAAQPLSPTRKTIARRMLASWQAAPHVTLFMDVDLAAAAALRQELKQALADGGGPPLTWNAWITWMAVQAAAQHGGINATLEDGQLTRHTAVNLGVAVDAPGGLVVPVIQRADRLRPGELAAELAAIAERARQGRLRPGDVSGGTFTVTNLGGFGITGFTPIINPPQVAILGVGGVAERLVAVDGQPAVRPVVTLSLSIDHRALDGADGARYLSALRDLLQNPYRLMV